MKGHLTRSSQINALACADKVEMFMSSITESRPNFHLRN